VTMRTTKTFLALLPLLAHALCALALAQAPSPHGATPPAPPEVKPDQLRVFTAGGKAASLDDVVAAMANADVVFVGEEHDDPGAHFVEAELLRLAYARFVAGTGGGRRPLALSLEMFERDVQPVVDEYLAGLITERHFLTASRPWPSYATDYRPLVEFAREHAVPVVAANAPGRYANRASRLGRESLDALPPSARAWIAPLPYGEPDPAYAAKFAALMGGDGSGPMAHGSGHLIDGQVLWDATMAYSIAQTLMQRPEALVLQVNGGFHSEERMGVPTQLARYRPGTRVLVVSIHSGQGFPSFDAAKLGRLGDFVVLTDPALKPAEEPPAKAD
jgi:uncharacterized iron-regulated protein